VVICAWIVQNMIVVAQMGSIRTTCFTSSTSVRVHSVHLVAFAGDSPLMTAAWSRNLHNPRSVLVWLYCAKHWTPYVTALDSSVR
jgi:hypothetical protein